MSLKIVMYVTNKITPVTTLETTFIDDCTDSFPMKNYFLIKY